MISEDKLFGKDNYKLDGSDEDAWKDFEKAFKLLDQMEEEKEESNKI